MYIESLVLGSGLSSMVGRSCDDEPCRRDSESALHVAAARGMRACLPHAGRLAPAALVPGLCQWRHGLSASPIPCRTFVLNRERAVDYLNMLERLYVFDGYAGWDPEVSQCTLFLVRMRSDCVCLVRRESQDVKLILLKPASSCVHMGPLACASPHVSCTVLHLLLGHTAS